MSVYLWPILASWTVFVCYWIYSSFTAKKNIQTQTRIGTGLILRVLIIVIVYALFKLQALAFFSAYDAFIHASPIIGIIADILCISGVAFAIWARNHLGKNWGMPMSVKESPELVSTGPYRYVRHPIYTGVLFAILGSTLVSGAAWFGIFIGGFIYFTYSAIQEEKLLLKEFPDTYPAYKQRTKMLIPFLF